MEFSGRGILLDIEGTTSSVSFVYDVMFPFVRRELERYLAEHWGEPDLLAACEQIAKDANYADLIALGGSQDSEQRAAVQSQVIQLMDDDIKATGLKMLQGQIWKSGFHDGELVAHVYADVVPAIQSWRAAGMDVRIYSSGSVQAQKLFFGHTEQGDLLSLFTAHYDTKIGSKREAASYEVIADEFGCAPADLLFCSDVVAELDAAGSAGWQTGLCLRPGNAPIESSHDHPEILSFDEVQLA